MRRQPLAGIVECQPYQVNLSDPASVGTDAFVRPAGKARVRRWITNPMIPMRPKWMSWEGRRWYQC